MKSNSIKRLLILAILVIPSVLWGQDVIVLRNGRRIESIVESIDQDNVGYRRWDNQQGPIYSVQTSKLLVILFGNGTTQTFDEKSNTQLEGFESSDTKKELLMPLWANPDAKLEGDRHGNLFLNGVRLTDIQAQELLNRGTGQNYFDTWQSGHRQYRTGKTLLGLGFACLGVSLACVAIASEDLYPDYSTAYIFAIPADVFICLGAVFKGIGRGRRNSVVDRYNDEL